MKETQPKHLQAYQIYQQQMQMSATIPELSKRNYEARNPGNWDQEWKEYLNFLHLHVRPLFRLVHGTAHLSEIKACNEIRAAGDRAQSDSIAWNCNTGGGISRTQWIYFSLRLPPYESVSFIGGGKAKIIIDLNQLDNGELLKGMWFAAHMSVFENNGIIATQKLGNVTRRAYYYRDKTPDQKADNQILCLSAKGESDTVTKKYLYSDMIFSAEEGLENFFENIFRFFIEQLQFCANHNSFFQELLDLNNAELKLTKTIHLWDLIFQGDSFEICVPGPIPLNSKGIEIDEQRKYFRDAALLFPLIDTKCSPNVRDCLKKTLGATGGIVAVQKAFTVREISPNIRSISKKPAVIWLVEQLTMNCGYTEQAYQFLSLFLENGADIQVCGPDGHSLLFHVASNGQNSYFKSLLLQGVKRNDGIIEYFNIAMNRTNAICRHFYTSSFFLETILAFADSTPIIENILPFCIREENAAFLAALLSNRTINPTLYNQSGLTPLMIAIKENLPLAVIQLLVAKSENVNTRVSKMTSNDMGWTALHFAVHTIRAEEEQKKLIELLLKNKADITLANQNGETPGMLLQRLSGESPEQYSGLQQSMAERLTTNGLITLHSQDATKQSVLISVLIQVQKTYYVLMIRKPISYSLAGRRGLPLHAIGQWWLPGGLIDPNETAVQAAARELFEETGFKIAEVDLIEIASDPNVAIPLSIVISKKIISCNEFPLIFAGSDAAVVFWVPYHEANWPQTKFDDLLWRKSNWLLVNEHMRFIRKDPTTTCFTPFFFTEFQMQLNYEETESFHSLGKVCSPEHICSPYLATPDNEYKQFKEQIYAWLESGGAFNQGNYQQKYQQLSFLIIIALAKRNDFEFYIKLLSYGLDPNFILWGGQEYFTPITYLWNLNIIISKKLQDNQSLTEEEQKTLQQNSARFIQFSLNIYQHKYGHYLDFSQYSVLSFVCRNNLHAILDELISLKINLNGYAAGCALVSALDQNHFDMVKRLLSTCTVDLNQAYPIQNSQEEVYPIQFFLQENLFLNAPDILQNLFTHGLRVIAFIEDIDALKSKLRYAEDLWHSTSMHGDGPPEKVFSFLLRVMKNLEIEAKVLEMLEAQLAREISMLYIESMPQRFFLSPQQQDEKQETPSNADKAGDFKGITFNS